jgi:hypothetical protein
MHEVRRLIIVVVQSGAVKIYVAAVEALRQKERQDETQFTTKIDDFLSFILPSNSNVLFSEFFFNLTVYEQTQGSGALLFLLYK